MVAITSNESKRDEARQLGADEVLVVKEHAGKELAAMGGVHVVISTSNDMKHNSQVIEGIRHEGKLVSMAISKEKMEIDPLFLLDHQLKIIGSQQCGRKDLVAILELAAAGKVKPKLETYPLGAVNAAMQRLAEGKVRYRAVLMHDGA